MIWDFIRDFFVQYIFGGFASDGNFYGGMTGALKYFEDGSLIEEGAGTVNEYLYQINDLPDGMPYYISLGDWLSTTATIIVMCLIVFLLICLVRWIFRAVSSAMLLK